jgi:hypothetical protein
MAWLRHIALLAPFVPAAALTYLASSPVDGQGSRGVAEALRRAAAPGDAVVVTPAWNFDALRHFDGLAAVAGTDAGAALRAGFTRVWVATPPWAPPPALPSRGSLRERRRVDGFTIDLVTGEAPASARHFDRARAWVQTGSLRTACARDGERLRCGSRDWQWVGPQVVSVHGAPQPCTWAHPISGAILAIEVPAVPLRGRLILRTFLADSAAARREGSVDVDLFAAGNPVARVEHPFTERALSRAIPVPTGIADLRLEIRAADDGRAHFCFDLEP